jgi:hypothetical protein
MTATKLVATIERGQDVYQCELRTPEADTIDRQWFLNGVPVHGPRGSVNESTVPMQNAARLCRPKRNSCGPWKTANASSGASKVIPNFAYVTRAVWCASNSAPMKGSPAGERPTGANGTPRCSNS